MDPGTLQFGNLLDGCPKGSSCRAQHPWQCCQNLPSYWHPEHGAPSKLTLTYARLHSAHFTQG